MKSERKDLSLNLRIFSFLLVVDCAADGVTPPCVNGGSCDVRTHVHVVAALYWKSLQLTVRSFRISSLLRGENTFTTFEMTICIRVSTNNYKLSVISVMHRDIEVKYTSINVTYSKQGLQMII